MSVNHIWKEDFGKLPTGVSANVKMEAFYVDGWEAYIAANGFNETDNYLLFENNKLKMVKSQGANGANTIMARKTLPKTDYTNTDEVVIEFDYSIDRPYDTYAYSPVIDVVNENKEQIYGLAFGSSYYGCFVIPHGKNSVMTSGMGAANEDNQRVFARKNDAFLSLCDGKEMHIKICLNLTGGYSETTITKNGINYTTPVKHLPLDTRLSSFNIEKIGLYAANCVQQPSNTPVVSTFDNLKVYGRSSVSGKLKNLADAIREKTGNDKYLSISEMTREVKDIIPAEWYMEDKITNAVNDKVETLRTCFFSNSSIETAKFGNLKTINYGAFSSCYSLTTVQLPAVTLIKMEAFANCIKLSAVVIGTKNCVLEDWTAFVSTKIRDNKGYIYVPDDAVETYKTATNWSVFADNIRPLSEWEG